MDVPLKLRLDYTSLQWPFHTNMPGFRMRIETGRMTIAYVHRRTKT